MSTHCIWNGDAVGVGYTQLFRSTADMRQGWQAQTRLTSRR